MPGGEEEPAVAAGSPFSGPCAAADAGGHSRAVGHWQSSCPPRTGAHWDGRRSSPPSLFGGLWWASFSLFDAGWGGCRNAGCPLVGRWVDCARSSGGGGKQRISARGGCACRAGRGHLLCPAGRGVARRAWRRRGAPGLPNRRGGGLLHTAGRRGIRVLCLAGRGVARRARRRRGAPGLPNRGEGDCCTRQGEEASTCCARQGEEVPAVHGGGEVRPVCQQGGGGLCTRQREKSARRFQRGERRLRGRREADWARQGAEGRTSAALGGMRDSCAWQREGALPRPARGKRGRGEIANKKRVILCIL